MKASIVVVGWIIVCGFALSDGFVWLTGQRKWQPMARPVFGCGGSTGGGGATDGDSDRLEHCQLERLANDLETRIRENRNPALWGRVYRALRDVEIVEWLRAIQALEWTTDGSVEADALLQEWENKFQAATAVVDESKEVEVVEPAETSSSSEDGKAARLLRYLEESVDEVSWNDEPPAVAVLTNPVRLSVELERRSLEDTLNEIEAMDKLVEIRSLRIKWKKTSRIFDLGSREKLWRLHLEELGLLQQGSVGEIKRLLKTSLQGIFASRGADIAEMSGLNILNFDVDYVSVVAADGKNWKTSFGYNKEFDKARVKVVAGESGSGKTVFSAFAPEIAIPGTAVLYAKPNAAEIQLFANETKFADIFCRSIAKLFGRDDVKRRQLLYQKLAHTKCLISFERNEKACAIAMEAWHDTTPAALGTWWDGIASTLPHLTLVLDEATQLDFACSIVDMGRHLCGRFLEAGLAERVDLMIVGTGLERVETSQHGTDPEKFVVLLVGSPNLKMMRQKHVNNEAIFGVENGSYSKVLATNSRMLFRAVLPILQQPYHTHALDEISEIPEERLKALASSRILMDFAIRYYLTQSSIHDLHDDCKTAYLDACFHYHLVSSQASMVARLAVDRPKLDRLLLVEKKESLGRLEASLFDRGLARSDGASSKALKLLSCLGRGTVLQIPESLEEMVGYHLARQAQVWDATNSYLFGKLENRWPPPIEKGESKILDHGSVKEIRALADAKMTDSHEEELCQRIRERCQSESQFSLTFWQGGDAGQGPDVFLLKVRGEEEEAILDVHHCQNFGKDTTTAMDWTKAWGAVGVGIPAKGAPFSVCRTGRRPLYANVGMEKLCDCIAEGTGLNVDVGNRVVVLSRAADESEHLNQDLSEGCKIITRELLEPTISCMIAGGNDDGGDGLEEQWR